MYCAKKSDLVGKGLLHGHQLFDLLEQPSSVLMSIHNLDIYVMSDVYQNILLIASDDSVNVSA
jgi:hypothetical protein